VLIWAAVPMVLPLWTRVLLVELMTLSLI